MNKITIGMVAACALMCAARAQTALPAFVTQENAYEKNCNGQFWHVQGIAITDDAVYCGLLRNILKFDLETGKCLKAVAAPYHTGDVCWSNGRLYTATLTNFEAAKKNPADARGLVQVYDGDLKLIREKEFPMGFDGITALDGILYLGIGIIGDTPGRKCKVVRVREATLELIDEIEIEPGFVFRSAVQDMATDGRHLFFSFYTVGRGKEGLAVFTKDLKPVKKLPHVFSSGFDRMPDRFQKPGSSSTLFGVLRSFKRRNAAGAVVPGHSTYLRFFEWNGETMRDVTPAHVIKRRDRPAR